MTETAQYDELNRHVEYLTRRQICEQAWENINMNDSYRGLQSALKQPKCDRHRSRLSDTKDFLTREPTYNFAEKVSIYEN